MPGRQGPGAQKEERRKAWAKAIVRARTAKRDRLNGDSEGAGSGSWRGAAAVEGEGLECWIKVLVMWGVAWGSLRSRVLSSGERTKNLRDWIALREGEGARLTTPCADGF